VRTFRLTVSTLSVALALSACSGSSATPIPSVAIPSVAIPSVAIPSVAIPPIAVPAAVAIAGFAYAPATLAVKVGTEVTWANTDQADHTVTFDDTKVKGSGNMPKGSTYKNTFDAAGTFAYHCRIHPTMTGTVTVS